MEAKPSTKIYLAAAQRVAAGHRDGLHDPCCYAIERESRRYHKIPPRMFERYPETKRWRKLFKPPRNHETWFGLWFGGLVYNVEGQNERILALCFAAAMTKTGDL